MLDVIPAATIAALAASLLVGAMVFFAAVVAPLVFKHLPEATAGPFIRQVFPVYYIVCFAFAALAALAAALARPVDAALLAAIAAGFLLARQGLMPAINAARDRHLAGDDAAGRRFERLHRASVWLNVVQLGLATVILVRLIEAA
jgi:hypothetical protein